MIDARRRIARSDAVGVRALRALRATGNDVLLSLPSSLAEEVQHTSPPGLRDAVSGRQRGATHRSNLSPPGGMACSGAPHRPLFRGLWNPMPAAPLRHSARVAAVLSLLAACTSG